MATYATLTINAADIVGADFDRSRCSAYIETNTPHGLVVADAENIRLGGRRENPDATGTITFPNLVTTNSADNPTSFAYKVTIVYVPKGSRKQGHDSITTSEFPLLANADLAAIPEAWDNVAVPVNWRSDFIAQAQSLLSDDVQAVAEDRAYVEGLVVADLGTTDGQASALMASPSSLLAQETEAKIAEVAAPRDPGTELLPARAALANRAATPFTIMCLGDSIAEGGNTSVQSRRWVDRLRFNLRTLRPTTGVLADADTSYLPAHDPSSLWNRGVISGTGWSTGSYYGYGGRSLTMSGTAKITYTVTGTEIALVGPTSGGLGVWSVKVDGGTATLISAGSPGGDVEHYWPVPLGASGSHTVEISVSSGTVVLNGIRIYNGANDDTTGIHVIDAGHSGWRSTDHDPAGDLTKQIANLDPQLGVIALMANDTYATVTPVATYKARLIALGNLFRAAQPYTRSVLFLAYPQRGAAGASVWPDYVQAMREAADEVNGGAAFLNLGERVPGYDNWGYPYFADTVHLTDATHGMVADAITDLLVR